MKQSQPLISTLQPDEIFCFGSNERGAHGAGAAKLAFEKFGAIWNKGFGLAGQTFAIPTKNQYIQTLSIIDIKVYVDYFLKFVKNHPDLKFLLTEIGCGLAGYQPKDIGPLFKDGKDLDNLYFPKEFIEYIN